MSANPVRAAHRSASSFTASFASSARRVGSPLRQRALVCAVASTLGGLALSGVAMPPAHAQSTTTAASPAPEIDYQIPAGPLAPALRSLASRANLLLSFTEVQTQGKVTAGLTGRHGAAQALAQLLQGTGLQAVRTPNQGYVLQSLPSGAAAPVTLPQVTVTASGALADELPATYAGGQIATGGRVGLLGNRDNLETPFSTVAYTEQYVRDRQVTDIGDVIGGTDPSVYVPQKRNYMDSFFIRGFNSNAIDTTFNGLAGMAPYMRSSTEFAERVEVLKGPSAMLNGMLPQGSVGGSVNLVPKRAGAEPLTRMRVSYESDSLWAGHLDVGRRFGAEQQFGIRFNGVYRNGHTAVDAQKMRNQLQALALDWRQSRLRLSLDLYRQNNRTDAITYNGISTIGSNVQSLPEPLPGNTLLVPPWSYGKEKNQAAIVRAELDFDPVTFYVAAGWQRTEYSMMVSRVTLLSADGDATGAITRLDTYTPLKTRSIDIGARGRFELGPTAHQWSVSASEFRRRGQFASAGATSPLTNVFEGDFGPSPNLAMGRPTGSGADAQLRSLAVVDAMELFDGRLQLIGGLRRQQVRNGVAYRETATTPSAAVLWRATGTTSFYVNYIEGLSQGGTAPANAANAGEALEPYRTRQSEMGVKYDQGDMALTVSAFRIQRPNAYLDSATNVFARRGMQRNTGLELMVHGQVHPGLRLNGGVAYTRARLLEQQNSAFDDKQATGVPKFTAKLGVEYDVADVPGLSLTGNVSYASRRYATNDNLLSLSPYAVVDLGLRYQLQLAERPVTLRAGVNNVFDKAYWSGSWGGGSGSGLSGGLGAPRTFLVSAEIDF